MKISPSLLCLKAISASMEFLVSPTFAASEIKLEEERCNLRLAEVSVTASCMAACSLVYAEELTYLRRS